MSTVMMWLGVNYIELIGVLAGMIGVWLTARQVIWCWPVALINVVIYIYVFFKSHLYADFGLQIFYLFMTLYGWYNWLYGGKGHTTLFISRIKKKLILLIFIIGIPSQLMVGFLLSNYTNADYPYTDSFVSVWGIIGTFLMARKIMEHWMIWIVADLTSIVIFYKKELHATSVLYLIFTILAIYGLIKWNREYKLQEKF